MPGLILLDVTVLLSLKKKSRIIAVFCVKNLLIRESQTAYLFRL